MFTINNIEDWESIVDLKNYIEMKIELVELKIQQYNLQGMFDDKRKDVELRNQPTFLN